MKKSTKMLKRFAALFLVVLMSIESFAAIVGDSDGGAFVTKQEFEDLKDGFDAQLDLYNDSLDNKIDGAIANFLAGRDVKERIELTNLFDEYGGKKIRFGRPALGTPTEPKSGWGIYFINCYPHGFNFTSTGAGWGGINSPSSTNWSNTDSGGQTGQFMRYEETDNGGKYLISNDRKMLQACYVGAWYSNVNKRNVTQDYPFGSAPTVLGQPVSVGAFYGIDCYTSTYRAYQVREWTDLKWYTSAWSSNTADDYYFVEKDEYNKPSDYRTARADYTQTIASGWTDGAEDLSEKTKITFTNLRLYGWKWVKDALSNYSPGFLNGSKYKTKTYGGVPFFEIETLGKVEIEKLVLKHTQSLSTYPDVIFAISSNEFDNDDTLKGNVKLTNLKNAQVHNESNLTYKAAVGATVSFSFDAEHDGTYYIKCQYTSTKPTANDSYYCFIEDGAKITFVEDR